MKKFLGFGILKEEKNSEKVHEGESTQVPYIYPNFFIFSFSHLVFWNSLFVIMSLDIEYILYDVEKK